VSIRAARFWESIAAELEPCNAIEKPVESLRCGIESNLRIVDPVLVSDVVEGADVGVIELRERLRLPLEALPPLGAPGEVLSQDFDGDRSLEPSVAGLVDLAHSTSSNESEDFVRA
jgi:hypothetical protein